MARNVLKTIHKIVENNNNLLEEAVKKFSKLKPAYDKLSKEIEALKGEIKTGLVTAGVDSYKVDNFSVTLQETHSYSFDNQKLIEWAKANGHEITVTVEMLDEDALESLLYNGEILPEQLKPFQKDKVVTKLFCKIHD